MAQVPGSHLSHPISSLCFSLTVIVQAFVDDKSHIIPRSDKTKRRTGTLLYRSTVGNFGLQYKDLEAWSLVVEGRSKCQDFSLPRRQVTTTANLFEHSRRQYEQRPITRPCNFTYSARETTIGQSPLSTKNCSILLLCPRNSIAVQQLVRFLPP
ncbi:uncharacterized protein BP01DRAFT_210867 [Aspergillus saccharolyticus JOP 1030-1]|uniref:Uncharacterized protein n=1 Tax=Aspergillus saccharolyticus JOP 1030-1 TaxID=1450539 RepID=A0A318Z6Z0_9EURO|nr:hypothetical protein BP01DRAFT_210867 [Aspergillus saccharolyticus JOP 1030-1]PYH40493.1 hypothetical protein BP01DRAFT_210867 [Aspergillus saccharolyticus JOP 1030-1]